jgi:hypothetical protein
MSIPPGPPASGTTSILLVHPSTAQETPQF